MKEFDVNQPSNHNHLHRHKVVVEGGTVDMVRHEVVVLPGSPLEVLGAHHIVQMGDPEAGLVVGTGCRTLAAAPPGKEPADTDQEVDHGLHMKVVDNRWEDRSFADTVPEEGHHNSLHPAGLGWDSSNCSSQDGRSLNFPGVG